jgi:hypothetical protein
MYIHEKLSIYKTVGDPIEIGAYKCSRNRCHYSLSTCNREYKSREKTVIIQTEDLRSGHKLVLRRLLDALNVTTMYMHNHVQCTTARRPYFVQAWLPWYKVWYKNVTSERAH